MTTHQYFYVYDKRLAKFLRYKKGIVWECHALHAKTQAPFWQFAQSQELRDAVEDFK
ncbi:hypothetical protein [Saccharibacillus brassicae]|uniref:hypothetical protein n=1 Tax=Saccharibacillus brassicae TaxID=2583377 RepID=UPI0014786A61|nr:hypothetical protein [Saccharibacillus brassicae]